MISKKRKRNKIKKKMCSEIKKPLLIFKVYYKGMYIVYEPQAIKYIQDLDNYNENFYMGFLKNRYSKINKHLARHFVYYCECLSIPSPFLCSQIINHFLNSMISTNHEKGLEFQPIIPLILSLVQNLFFPKIFTTFCTFFPLPFFLE